jgi:anti-sigma regulatory factor (Ser/Thr protein kinase)
MAPGANDRKKAPPTGGRPLVFELSPDLGELDRLREMARDIGEALRLTERCVFQLNLAIEECFTNILAHGLKDRRGKGQITVRLSRQADQIVVRLEDDGLPFDPSQAAPPDLDCTLEERPEGGLGIYLTRQIMDAISYERCAGKNLLTLKKTIEEKGHGDPPTD